MNIAQRSNYAGFTLIELLVVVAIIAVLIAMLMPALNKARQMTKLVKCQSQQRQMAIGMIMYAEEHEDWLLPPSHYNPTTTYVKDVPLSEEVPSRFWFDILPYIGAVNVAEGDTLAKTGDILYCPAAPGFRELYGSGWGSSSATVGYTSYANYCYWGPEYTGFPYTLSGSPARATENGGKIMFGDITSPTQPSWTQHDYKGVLRGGNFAHLDGHVRWYVRDELFGYSYWELWAPTNRWLRMALPDELRFMEYSN